jgi:hypothetical protein
MAKPNYSFEKRRKEMEKKKKKEEKKQRKLEGGQSLSDQPLNQDGTTTTPE